MKKRTKTILKTSFIIIGLFIAIVLIINTSPFDEDLNPQLIEILKDKPMPALEDNAFFAIMGMRSAGTENMSQVGFDLMTRYRNNLNNGKDELTVADYEEITKVKKFGTEQDRQWVDKIYTCNSKEEFNCLTKTSNLLTDDILQNQQLQMMLNRYQKIINMKSYKNYQNITYLTPTPGYQKMFTLSQVKLASDYRPEFRDNFLPSLVKDLAFWKLQMTQGLLLIDKMIGYAGVKKDLNYLSEYIRNNEISDEETRLIESMLIPLTYSEIDLSESFKFESRGARSYFVTKFSEKFDFKSLLFQPNATMNLYYKQLLESAYMDSDLTLKIFIERRKSQTTLNPGLGLNPKSLYNLTGKLLTPEFECACHNYIGRGYDLINVMKMVSIQLYIKQDKDNNIKSILNKHENLNPYNSQPFDFNSETNEMSFECLDDRSNCKIHI
jgi:hypothetical protein